MKFLSLSAKAKVVKAYLRLMRLDRPIPILMILWPTFWALFAAGDGRVKLKYLVIFSFGVILMRTAGCIFNDIFDRNFDRHVARTRKRPITSGEISVKAALIFGLLLLFIAFIFVLFLNLLTILLSFVAVFLALSYPLFKRFFALPQLALGLAFNFGVIMAYSAEQNTVPEVAWLMYFACVFWTLAYDSIYALADQPYDIRLKLKSSTVTFGRHIDTAIGFFQIAMLGLLALFADISGYSRNFYFALILCLLLFYLQYRLWRKRNIADCIRAFSDNHWVGLVIFIAILLQLQ